MKAVLVLYPALRLLCGFAPSVLAPFVFGARVEVADTLPLLVAKMLLADQVLQLFQNRPEHWTASELEPDDKPLIALLLTINNFGFQRRFSHCGSNLHYLAEVPRNPSEHANAKPTDIFDDSSFPPFSLRGFGSRELYFHYDGKPFFFSSGETTFQCHALCALFPASLRFRAGIALGLGGLELEVWPGWSNADFWSSWYSVSCLLSFRESHCRLCYLP